MPTTKAVPSRPAAAAATRRNRSTSAPRTAATAALKRTPATTIRASATRKVAPGKTAVGKNIASNRKASPQKQPVRKKPIVSAGKRKKKKGVPGQKRYRRVKVFRPCVIRLAFLIPLAILAIERYLGFVISLDDVRDVYYDQMGIDPWEIPPTRTELLGTVIDLANLTYTPQIQCPMGQRRMISAHNPQFYGLNTRKVPNIVHQAAKTRCLTRNFDRASIAWAFRRHSYYIHDMDAVLRLVRSDFPEFPQLRLILDSCLPPPLLFGLWQYLVLWCYGGIFADLNSYPSQFNATTISNQDDGFFLLEEGSATLTTMVMAVSPRHPLMYYAVQHCISNIMKMKPNTMYNPREIVGEGALNQALADFRRGGEKHQLFKKKAGVSIGPGTWEGMFGRSLRIGGSLQGPNDEGIITPIFISKIGKGKEFEKIGMSNWDEAIPGSKCVGKLLNFQF